MIQAELPAFPAGKAGNSVLSCRKEWGTKIGSFNLTASILQVIFPGVAGWDIC